MSNLIGLGESTLKLEKGEVPYLLSPELRDAVNLAIRLENRPLLIKGDPGCGKTTLAKAVADELGFEYESWYIKSTTRAKDGLYFYDAVRRLQDAQLSRLDDQLHAKVTSIRDYIYLGPLGRAIINPRRTVLLIDEIDKADIDFPNDLLREIDEQKFVIDELRFAGQEKPKEGEQIQFENKATYPPVIFITSNDEKDLPDAFLRRCLFHYIQFPSDEHLIEIVKLHFVDLDNEVVKKAVAKFSRLRQKMVASKDRFAKKPSTSELLDWVNVLSRYGTDEILKQLDGKLPFHQVLIKKWADHERYYAGS